MRWNTCAIAGLGLCVGLLHAPNALAISILDNQSINFGGANRSLPFTDLALVGYDASAASKLVVTIHGEDGFNDDIPTGVSFGSDAFQLAVTDTNGIQQAWIFYLDATDVGGTFGTADLVIEGSGSDDFVGLFFALSGTADGVGHTASDPDQDVVIDTTVDGSIVIAAHANNGSGATAQSPLIPVLDSDAGSAGGGAGYFITDPAVIGETYAFTGSSNRPVTVAAVFEPGGALTGDFDGDGDVDGVDVAEMFTNFNGPGGGVPTNPATDLDGDGDADGVDVATLFGLFTGPLAPATVPEPGSLSLLGLAGLLMTRPRHRRTN